jgi:hypothetical protein
VVLGNETCKPELQIRRLHLESGRQIIWQESSQSPVVWQLHEVIGRLGVH